MRLNGHDAFRKSEVVDLGGGRKIELAEVLGRGEGSVVYAGVLSSAFGVRRRVAVKMFPSLSSDDAEVVAEALAVAAAKGACVEHPNVVRTYEFGFFYGQPHVVMERVDGVSLRTFLEHAVSGGRRVPLDLALYVGAEIAAALDGARTARGTDGVHLGLNHLALSASEVLLSWRGEVKVADFGYSSARAASSTVRSLRSVAKRVDTMSPEVARGRKGDARSDVFSLGLLVRELLVGPRFPRGMAHDEILSLARDGHILGRCIEPDLPGDLANILHRALQVDPDAKWRTTQTFDGHACGLKTDDTLWCWGENGQGQLGDGTTGKKGSPTPIELGSTWNDVGVGTTHSCAIRNDQSLFCWGDNRYGQLGDGTTTSRTTPTAVGLKGPWLAVSVGVDHSCGLRGDLSLWCWGLNVYGQLGDGTLTDSPNPHQVFAPAGQQWQKVNARLLDDSCALTSSGQLFCWGLNNYDQLSIGSREQRDPFLLDF